MSTENNNDRNELKDQNPPVAGTAKQEQSDPQITELRGFVNADEDLEPTLTDGTKSPDKAGKESEEDKTGE